MTTAYDFAATTIDGAEQSLSAYKDKVLLIVNVASKCGFTPQYAGLEDLYRKHVDSGFVMLGFPCDQFGHQEPGDEAEIKEFCSLTYDVTFPMFAKIEVNGDGTHPLYNWLKEEQRGVLGGRIKWNFTKFLVDREGQPVRRFAPNTTPEEFADDVEKLL
jgi:glutathione peroxidase